MPTVCAFGLGHVPVRVKAFRRGGVMIGWGITLAVLGFGSLVMPMFGLQFKIMSLLDGGQPFAGIIIGVVGVILVVAGFMKRSSPAAAEAE